MVVIIDFGMGNLGSVQKACLLSRKDVVVSSDVNVIRDAERLILPGVGAFGDGSKALSTLCLREVISDSVKRGVPLLGICLGMQLLGLGSEEDVGYEGLGLIPFNVVRFKSVDGIKVPHVGWNNVYIKNDRSGLFSNVIDGSDFYFVHSYHVDSSIDSKYVVASCDYGEEFACSVAWKNVIGVQFHPEKSQKYGLKVIDNFLRLGLQC